MADKWNDEKYKEEDDEEDDDDDKDDEDDDEDVPDVADEIVGAGAGASVVGYGVLPCEGGADGADGWEDGAEGTDGIVTVDRSDCC